LIACAVLAILAGLQLVRVNAPESTGPIDEPFRATTGAVLDGTYVVPAGQYLSVKIDLNHRAKLAGWFRTQRREMLLSCLVIDDANFGPWKNDAEYRRLSETGHAPGGKVSVVAEAGTYHLVLDNRRSDADVAVEAHFSVD
jgi:hypothetical protein